MLITENIMYLGKLFVHNYSDSNFYIRRNDDIEFADALDTPTAGWTYTETNKPIESDEDAAPEEAEE